MIIVTTSSGRRRQSNTQTVSAPFSPAVGGTRGRLPRGGQGGTVRPLSLEGCWASASAGGCSVLRGGSSVGPLWLSRPRCPVTGLCVPLVLRPCRVEVLSPTGAPTNYGFFLYFFRFIFLLFWQQTYPSRCPGESKTAHRGLPPCQPLHAGVRGEGPWAGARPLTPAQPNRPAEAGNLGYRPPRCPPSHPTGR